MIKKIRFQSLSLGLRLTIMFLGASALVWLASGVMSWRESREQLDEFFDSYQLLLAHQLAAADWQGFTSKDEGKIRSPLDRLDEDGASDGEADEEALAFAVFNNQGQLVFSDGDEGRGLPFDPETVGFVNRKLNKSRDWRLVWITSSDGLFKVVVGQRREYRSEAALDLTAQTLTPWLAGLLVLTVATIWMVSRELKPLRGITGDLAAKAADDLTPLKLQNLPSEVAPLGLALNRVFERLKTLLVRERAFVSDAAHELRTPLTALRVQAEVAQLSHDDPPVLKEALGNLITGIDRTTRLVEQLLALSRLDGGAAVSEPVEIDWPKLIQETIIETETAKRLTVNLTQRGRPMILKGRPILLGLMLRNLLDNARRYSPEGAVIDITAEEKSLTVTNSGVTVEAAHLRRLGERFFRPPGQAAGGSGLGLSIVGRVAELHSLKVEYINHPPGSFSAVIKPV